MSDQSSKISLIIGLALPALMVAGIAALVFLPNASLKPTTDFIYVVGPYPSYTTRTENTTTQHEIAITNGKLTHTETNYTENSGLIGNAFYPPNKNTVPRFFMHHTATDTNEEIDIEKIRALQLSSDRKSPDGFSLTFGKQSYGVFPFFFDNNSDREHAYLSTDHGSKEITLVSDTSITYYEFQLVGWVIANR